MSNLSLFMKKNKKIKENAQYAATKSLCDEKGKVILWEVRPITTAENEKIRDECMAEISIPGKKHMYRPKLNTSLYITKLIVSSVIEPNLNSAELQDSYEVKTPEELVKAMVDNPGEYTDFAAFIQEYNGFTTLEDEVEEAKN